MRMFLIGIALSLGVTSVALSGCSDQSHEPHPSLQNPELWSYGIDPHGTRAEYGDSLIQGGVAQIAFDRVPRPGPESNSWVELIYYAPEGHLHGVEELQLTYQSSEPLLVKFSQSDYGEEGDNSFAHYQARIPATDGWHTARLLPEDFGRPDWTPADSLDVGLRLENVNAIYMAPDLSDETGGYAELKVKAVELMAAE